MILHRIRIENWRALRDPLELGPFNPAINIIHGPNEAGKSTIMDAICRGFFDRHSTGGEDMKARQPWDSDLGPAVCIEFEGEGERYQLKKQYLVDPSCEFSHLRDGKWERMSTGKTADDRIAELARGDSSARGLTHPEHWGLGQVLWTRQGEATHLEVGGSQQARLHEALKISLDTAQGEAIEQAVKARYDEVYTPGGKLRGGQNRAEVARLDEEFAEATAAIQKIQTMMAEVDQLAHDLESGEGELKQIQAEHQQAEADLKAARAQLQALSAKQLEYERLKAAADKVSTEWAATNDRVNRIKQADDDADKAAKDVAKLEKDHTSAESQLKSAQTARDKAKTARDDQASTLRQLQLAQQAAERAVRWLELDDRLDKLQEQQAKAERIQAEIHKASKELDEVAAPTKSQLTALRKQAEQIRQAAADLAAASLAVRIEPEGPLSVQTEIDGAKQPSRKIKSSTDLTALGTIGLTIEKVGRIIVRAGKTDAAKLSDHVEELRSKWREKTAEFASEEVEQLEELATKRQLMEGRLKDLESQAEEVEEPASLADAVAEVEKAQKVLLAEDGKLADLSLLMPETRRQAEQATSVRESAGQTLEQLEDGLQEAVDQFETTREAETEAAKVVAAARATADQNKQQAARIREEDGLSDSDRRAKLKTVLQAKDEAQQRLEAAEKPPVDDLAEEVGQLEEQLQSLANQQRTAERRITQLDTQLTQAGGQGLYSQLVSATERQEDLARQAERAHIDAEAIKLLWDTLQRHKQGAFEAVVEPVRRIVVSSMQQLVGPQYEAVSFDERLMPTSIRPRARAADAQVADLSFGTQEQLMLLVRLALARLLGRDGDRQCLILDDPLVNTDRGRHRAALRILEQTAGEAQILLFTCHPVAYQGLSGSSAFDLEDLAGNAQKARR